MLYFSRLKTGLILLVCLVGVLLAAPNLLPAGAMPSWLPLNRVNLGLDLQGGSYLMLKVDLAALRKERMENQADSVRQVLRDAKVRYTGLTADDTSVRFALVDTAQADAARTALNAVDAGIQIGTTTVKEFDITVDGPSVSLVPNEKALQERARQTVGQSIEIVRRRIDQSGVAEPLIARQGEDRIVVQLPGLADPTRIKALLGQTAKMTFHLLGDSTVRPGSPAPGRDAVAADG